MSLSEGRKDEAEAADGGDGLGLEEEGKQEFRKYLWK
jgi:hypothetical protein